MGLEYIRDSWKIVHRFPLSLKIKISFASSTDRETMKNAMCRGCPTLIFDFLDIFVRISFFEVKIVKLIKEKCPELSKSNIRDRLIGYFSDQTVHWKKLPCIIDKIAKQ